MTKDKLARIVANMTGLSVRDAKDSVDATLDVIMQSVQDGDAVILQGFGSFTPVHKEERIGRNPATGEAITIAARTGVKFKAGKAFKDCL
jgi:DNA-binding protein HU-beta